MCNFSSSIEFLKEITICPGCVKGKMLACTYHLDSHHASKPFELIYSDIKSFPILSYHKYWYIITFFNDFIFHGWSAMLHTKSAALQAAKYFLSMISTQYDAKVKGWISNAGGEYRSEAFDKLLAGNRITAYQSAPHIPQQNGHTERFMWTIMDKSGSMHLQACIPEFYWEISWTHAIHIYNRTPLWHHDWQTPYEKLNQQSSDIRHFHVFDCRAYIHLPADSAPIRWPLNQSSWCTWTLHLIMTRTSCSCVIPRILNLFLYKCSLMSSYFPFVISLSAHVLKLLLSRMMRMILISPHSMAMMMTYHLLLHHLLTHLSHLVHACLNMLLVPSHPPEGHVRLPLSTAHL